VPRFSNEVTPGSLCSPDRGSLNLVGSRGPFSSRSIVFDALCAKGGQFRGVPAAAESFDEEHAGIHTPPENVDRIPFVREFDGLCSDDLQVGVN
jgi:hypothetical protein